MGDITFTAQTRFENNLRLVLSQHTSKLGSRAIQRDEAGAEKVKLENLISNGKAKRKNARHQPVSYNTTGWDGIWVAKTEPYYDADLVDTDDKLVTAVDLQGGIMLKQASVMQRAEDDAFLEGFFGDLITGKTGTTLNAFPSGNVVAVDKRSSGSGATGMNTKKLRTARKILAQNYVNMEQDFYIALSAAQIDNLFDEVIITSRDYQNANSVRFSPDGKTILGAAGFEFVEIELGNPDLANASLTLDASSYRKNPFWTADGMAMNWWERLYTSVKQLPQQHDEWQIYCRKTMTASRTDQNRCGYVLNSEA